MKIEGGSELRTDFPANPPAGPEFAKKLRKAGEEFESMLLTDVFTKLQQSFSMHDGKNADPGHETLSSIADKALCDSLAARGGLGIGAMVSRPLTGK